MFCINFNTYASSCKELSVSRPKAIEFSTNRQVRSFEEQILSQEILTNNNWNLTSVNVPYIRKQCTNNCVYQAHHVAAERTVKNEKKIDENSFISGFVNQMKLFYKRSATEQVSKNSYSGPMKGLEWLETSEAVSALDGSVYTFKPRAEDYKKELEQFVESDELLIKFIDKEKLFPIFGRKKLQELIKLELPDFINEVVRYQENYLSDKFGREVRLESFDQPVINYDEVRVSLFRAQFKMYKNGGNEYKKISFDEMVFKIIEKVNKNELVPAAFEHLFGLNTSHQVLISGYVKNKSGEIVGFEYLNSMGEEAYNKGRAFMTVQEFASHIANITFFN